MFLDDPSPTLRQGDLSVVDAFPVWQVDTASSVMSGAKTLIALQLPVAQRALRPPSGEGQLVMVCSHSCDLENPRARTGLLVAPILRVPASEQKEADRYHVIISSHTPDDKGRFEYVQFFPVQLPASLGAGWAVADFSGMISMGKAGAAAEVLASAKVAQLSDAYRRRLQEKIAVFVGAPDRAASAGKADSAF